MAKIRSVAWAAVVVATLAPAAALAEGPDLPPRAPVDPNARLPAVIRLEQWLIRHGVTGLNKVGNPKPAPEQPARQQAAPTPAPPIPSTPVAASQAQSAPASATQAQPTASQPPTQGAAQGQTLTPAQYEAIARALGFSAQSESAQSESAAAPARAQPVRAAAKEAPSVRKEPARASAEQAPPPTLTRPALPPAEEEVEAGEPDVTALDASNLYAPPVRPPWWERLFASREFLWAAIFLLIALPIAVMVTSFILGRRREERDLALYD